MKRLRILFLLGGRAPEEMEAKWGGLANWFRPWLPECIETETWVAQQDSLPPIQRYAGFVMPGSQRSVTQPEAWMDRAGDYLLRAGETRPVLGVCFGHQILGRALGVPVVRAKKGREAGTKIIRQTSWGRGDPLFEGLPHLFSVQQSHADELLAVPPGASLLATNAHSSVQAFAFGAIRGLQFHPEMTSAQSHFLAQIRRNALDRCVSGGYQAVAASIRKSPAGPQILANWIHRFVEIPVLRRSAQLGPDT